jgi:hypothetical protein
MQNGNILCTTITNTCSLYIVNTEPYMKFSLTYGRMQITIDVYIVHFLVLITFY